MISEASFSENILNTLDSFFADGRRPHAMLIDGGSEEEREALAQLGAKMLVCENKNRTPCGECEQHAVSILILLWLPSLRIKNLL